MGPFRNGLFKLKAIKCHLRQALSPASWQAPSRSCSVQVALAGMDGPNGWPVSGTSIFEFSLSGI